jgi:oligopeptide transport system substrate-binding protein
VMLPNVWSGLLGFDENGGVVPDLAESMETSDDGLTYTFVLREGLTYANGRGVVAEHFISSWRRALDPLSLSPMASFMEPVAGYAEFIQGDSDELGFRAIDERTLEIRLREAYSFFPAYLATFVWAVIDPEVAVANPTDLALRDAGAGAWRFTEFASTDRFVMEPNPRYWEGVSPSLGRINWIVVDGPDASATALSLYQQEQSVSADVPLSLQSTISEDETLAAELVRIEQQSSTIAIGMDFRQPPFDDIRVRRALAASIDRERWATEIWSDSFVPASAFTPPVIRSLADYEPPALIPFDAETARSLLAEAGFDDESQVPEITYYLAAERAASEGSRADPLLAMIQENSGLTIRLDTTKTQEQIDAQYQDQGGRQFDLVWWWAATDTPSLLGYACRTDAEGMAGVFNWNPDLAATDEFSPGEDAARFDEATRQADVTQDQGERNALYREAEELLLRNAVYIPLGHWVQAFVQKPWLTGTRQGPWSGRLPVRFDRNVVVLEH